MRHKTLIRLLVEMAEIVDRPGGPGGGAILLEAAAEIEALGKRLAFVEALDRLADLGIEAADAAGDGERQ